MTLGTTHLAVGPSDKPWPVESFPDFQLNPAKDEPVADAPAPEEPKVPAPAAASPAARRRGSIWPIAAAALLLLFPLLVIGALWYWPVEKQVNQPKLSQVSSIVAKHNKQGNILKHRMHKDMDLVQGYVKTAATARKITAELRKASPGMAVWIWDSESLTRGVQTVFGSMHIKLKAAPGGLGEVIVSGDLPGGISWEDVQRRILQDLRPLRRLTIQNATGGNVSYTSAEPPLPEIPEDFSPQVLVDAQKPRVEKPHTVAVNTPKDPMQAGTDVPEAPTVAGTEPEAVGTDGGTTNPETAETNPETASKVESPEAVTPDKIKTAGPTVFGQPLQTAVAPKPEAPKPNGPKAVTIVGPPGAALIPEALKIELQSISVGANQTVTMPGGKRLFVGARLPGGHRISAITPDGIMLEKNGAQRFYRLGGSP